MTDTLIAPDDTTAGSKCPHCRKVFEPTVDVDQPPRLQGAKCPHCRLFVPVRLLRSALAAQAGTAGPLS